MKTRATLGAACALAMLISFGCQNTTAEFQPAYIDELDSTQLNEVATLVSSATGSERPAQLSSTAFRQTHILVLVPRLSNTPLGKLATGRQSEKPETFHLLSNGRQCVLQNVKTNTSYPLSFPCATSKPVPLSQDLWIESRGTQIPVTLVVPAQREDETPLVLLIHGHGGTRHEAGGFTQVAQALAQQGIASIRMDFPGCGDSKESFTLNNLSNMLADIEAAKAYAQDNLQVDATRLGMLGYSMGGRLAILLSASTSFQAMALWAPAATDGAGSMTASLGGAEQYKAMKEQAKTNGYAPYTTSWGQQQKLGYQWFIDMENSTPSNLVRQFNGHLFVLSGSLDTVVKPLVSRTVFEQANKATSRKFHSVEGADHGLGLFSNQPELTAEAVAQTAAFFGRHL